MGEKRLNTNLVKREYSVIIVQYHYFHIELYIVLCTVYLNMEKLKRG